MGPYSRLWDANAFDGLAALAKSSAGPNYAVALRELGDG
jgi:hypothetical protein